jgi:hypothetical protein
MTLAERIGLVVALAGVSGGVYAIKKATIPPTLRDLPALARVAAPSAGSVGVLPNDATLEEELKLVHGSQAALEAKDTSRAFLLLYEHATRFPRGKLNAERQVTHLVALCRAGKVGDAHAELADFLAKNPHAPLAAELQGVRCAE